MSQEQDGHPAQSSTKVLGGLFANPPWTSPSFLAVGAATAAAFVAWLNDVMSPALVRGGASYLAGFVIGWVCRRAIKITAITTGAILALIALLKSAGWIDLDWSTIEQDVSQSLTWLREEADSLKQLLTGYLPAAGAGTAGAFFGFRKKS